MDHGSEVESAAVSAGKRALRARMLARRAVLSAEEVRRVGDRIADRIAATAAFRRARRVALYAASGGEPDLRRLFDLGREAGKTMLLPRCASGRRLAFHVVEDWRELAVGRYGVFEPPGHLRRVAPEALDGVLVPAVAVGREGGRLGRGGGWYDRTFPGRATGHPWLVAAVHAFQVVDHVPSGPLDRAVDGWVTEAALGWSVAV